jgi:hypothetical protein
MTKWLPLIRDPDIEHPRITLKKKVDAGETIEPPTIPKKTDESKKKKTKKGGKTEEKKDDPEIFRMKYMGDFAKSFLPWYDPQAMTPPLTEKQVIKLQAKIYKEVEIAIKQVRSSRNLNANLKNNHMTRTIMAKYMDYLEDKACWRLPNPKKTKISVDKELMKLVPEQFKISMLPAFFNHIDSERIGTVIRDTSGDFLIDTPKKVLFSIAVKIYPYNSEINSVRVVLVKLHPFEGAVNNEDENGSAIKSKSGGKSNKTKSNKSKSQADP